MKNPWTYLPDNPPFVLPEDQERVELFNKRWKGSEFELVLNEIPSPYIGDPLAPVVLLNSNAGYSPQESLSPNIKQYHEVAKKNLAHEFGDYPYYVLDPSLEGTPSGHKWFSQKLFPLIQATGMTSREISKHLFTAEYLSYSSKRFRWEKGILPSQKYTFHLVEQAIDRGAVIIVMRSKKLWFEAVPSLHNYPYTFILRSPQNVAVSENNLGTEAFNTVVAKIKSRLK